MVNITLSIDDEIKRDMEKFPEINWSEIARAAIRQRVMLLKEFNKFTKDSSLTEDDALGLGKEINREVAKKYSKKNATNNRC